MSLPRLQVSPRNPHLLQTADGKPFLLLGDTAWTLLLRLNHEEVSEYLDIRESQGFRMIWFTGLGEFGGATTANRHGDLPLIDLDPRKLNRSFWDWVDWVFGEIARRHMFVGFLPCWGDKVTAPWGSGPLLFPGNDLSLAYDFAATLANRLAHHSNILWVLGGDRPAWVEPGNWTETYAKSVGLKGNENWIPVWRAMADGIRHSLPQSVITFHPQGGNESTSHFLNGEPWLDLHAMQSGHGGGRDVPVWDMIHRDRALTPARPTFDAEVNYEDSPVSPWPVRQPELGYFDEYDVRRQVYRGIFAGGCGVVYGHHSVWQFASPEHPQDWILHTKLPWREALHRPGASQLHHIRTLLEQSDFHELTPVESLISPQFKERAGRRQALKSSKRFLAYLPIGGELTVPDGVRPKTWFDPRSGGRFPVEAKQNRTEAPNDADWVFEGDVI